MDYKLSLVTKADEPAVNEFLHVHFYSSEPLNTAIQEKFNATDPSGAPHYASMEYQNFANGLCVKAVDGGGTIVGVAISATPGEDLARGHYAIRGDRLIMDEIVKFLKFIDKEMNYEEILARHNSRVMDVKDLAVSSAHRKKGIGARLIAETISIADSKNLAVSIGCSSAYTSQIVEKMPQFKRVLSYPYSKYADSDGNVMFNVADPHVTYNVYLYEK